MSSEEEAAYGTIYFCIIEFVCIFLLTKQKKKKKKKGKS